MGAAQVAERATWSIATSHNVKDPPTCHCNRRNLSSCTPTPTMDSAASGPGMSTPVSLGTTIAAFQFDGGVMIAADTRTSTGNYIANRVTDKITPLSESVYLLRSGSAADTQAIAGYVQHFIAQHQAEKNGPVDVETAANLIMQLAYNNKNNLSAGMIVAGWDKREGAAVYAVPLGGTMLKVPFALGGSGSSYITGFVDRNYKEGMTEAQCRELVVKALGHAIRYDASSGGCIRIVTIDSAGARREFIPNTQIPLGYGELPAPVAVAAS